MKVKNKYFFLFIFSLSGVINILVYPHDEGILKVVSTVLLVPFIVFFYRSSVIKQGVFFQLALLFSLIGDIIFLTSNETFFIKLTVISYFFTQLFLIIETRRFINNFNYRFLFMGILLFASYLIVFLNHVYTYLGDMKIYAIVYGLTISYLGSVAVMYFFQEQTKFRCLLFLGVLFYSFRDVLLTFNVKVFKEQVFTYSIPFFYILGLFLIVLFFINASQTKRNLE